MPRKRPIQRRAQPLPPMKPAVPIKRPPPMAEVAHTNLSILTTDEPLLMHELRANRKIGPLLLTEISETTAVIRPGAEDEIAKLLLKEGHLPKVKWGDL